MNTQRTPGPWTVHRSYNNDETYSIEGNGRIVAWTGDLRAQNDIESESIHPEDMANARLIAAAPNMLTALRLIADSQHNSWCEWNDVTDSGCNCHVGAERDAILKATGA